MSNTDYLASSTGARTSSRTIRLSEFYSTHLLLLIPSKGTYVLPYRSSTIQGYTTHVLKFGIQQAPFMNVDLEIAKVSPRRDARSLKPTIKGAKALSASCRMQRETLR